MRAPCVEPCILQEVLAFLKDCLPDVQSPLLAPLGSGRNNLTFRLKDDTHSGANGPWILKRYFYSVDDPRDRFGAETDALRAIQHVLPGSVPKLIATKPESRLALLSDEGSIALESVPLQENHLRLYGQFLSRLGEAGHGPFKFPSRLASEAAFSLAAFMSNLGNRIERLVHEAECDVFEDRLNRLLRNELQPLTKQVLKCLRLAPGNEFNREISANERIFSPSDVGVHNVLVKPDGALIFIDFEYAGWDDPVKLLSDFFLQPRTELNSMQKRIFFDEFCTHLSPAAKEGLRSRLQLAFPIFALKWVTILLNEFLPSDARRRAFAKSALAKAGHSVILERKHEQLLKAESAVHTFLESVSFETPFCLIDPW